MHQRVFCPFLLFPALAFFIFLLGRSCLDSYVSLSFVALLLQHITLWLVSPGLDRSKLFALELFPSLCGSSNWCFCSRLSDCLRSLGRAALLSNGLNHKLLQRNSQLELGWHFCCSFVLFQIALQNPCICFKSITICCTSIDCSLSPKVRIKHRSSKVWWFLKSLIFNFFKI